MIVEARVAAALGFVVRIVYEFPVTSRCADAV